MPPAQKPNPPQTINTTVPHILTEDREKHHLKQIAQHLTEATNNQVLPANLVPTKNINPLPQFDHPVEQKTASSPQQKETMEEEVMDVVEGLQGKPRTGRAIDFLKDKLLWMRKKHGNDVKLTHK